MGNVIINDSSLTNIANAIRAKNGTTNTYKPSEMADAITAITGGGSGTEWVEPPIRDVCFWDYDGTLLYSYTLADAKALTVLPTPPQHTGLIFESWNWSLTDIQALDRPCDIGAFYRTDDDKTRLYVDIDITKAATITLYIGTPNNTTYIDWADGSSPTKLSSITGLTEITHTYTQSGEYIIKIYGGTHKLGLNTTCIVKSTLYSDESYMLKKIEMSKDVLQYSIANTRAITAVAATRNAVLHSTQYSSIRFIVMGDWTINNASYFSIKCYSLRTISVAKNTVIKETSNMFYYNGNLKRLVFPENTITKVSYDMFNTVSTEYVDIPASVTTISGRAFDNMQTRILVIRGGEGLTIDSAFNYATCVKYLYMMSPVPPTLTSNSSIRTTYTKTIYVPAGCAEAYKTATNWTTLADKIVEMEA